MNENPTDNSVQFALAELEALESARVQAEAEEASARKAAEAAAEARAAEAAAQARREAEAVAAREAAIAREKAKLDVDAEVEARTADGDRKIASMRAELDRIRAERSLIHDRMLASSMQPPPERPARHWPVIAGLLGATASVLGVLLFGQATAPAPEPEVIIREVHVPIAPAMEPQAEPEPVVEAEPVVETAPEPEAPAVRRPRPRPRPDTHAERLDRMNDCGDDPLCGLE